MTNKTSVDKERVAQVRAAIEKRVQREFGVTAKQAVLEQIYEAAALCVRDEVMDVWAAERERSQTSGDKCLIYLCAEYLIGRAFSNNLVNLGLYETYQAALSEMGYDLGEVEEMEADAGLGNGGLGRLAACFLDSLSTLSLPAIGYGIRYEYGFFRQEIEDGKQVEVPDTWSLAGDVWEAERADRVFEVKYGGYVDEQWSEDGKLTVNYVGAQSVMAEAYDMTIVGYESKLPATLRLWRARAPQRFDLARFNRGDYAQATAERELAESISKVLYPEDSHEAGQELRDKSLRFSEDAMEELELIFHAVEEVTDLAVTAFVGCDMAAANRIDPLEQVVDDLKAALRDRHIRRLQRGECSTTLGFVFTDILTDLERISDLCSNVAMSVLQMRQSSFESHSYEAELKRSDAMFAELYGEYREKYRLT